MLRNTAKAYNVISRGRRKFVLLRRGNVKPTKIYPTYAAMRTGIGELLFTQYCIIFIHNLSGSVERILTSK